MDMREWLSIIFIVLLVLILLDGFRRKWIERRRSLRFKLDKNIPPEDDNFDYEQNHELPNGGARLISDDESPYYGRATEDEFDEEDKIADDFDGFDKEYEDENSVEGDAAEIDDEPGSEYFEEEEPASMEYVDDDDELEPLDEFDEPDDLDNIDEVETSPAAGQRIEPSFGASLHEDVFEEELMVAEDQTELFMDDSGSESDEDEAEAKTQHAQEVIVFNVMAKSGEMFSGPDLLPILMEQGMRLGDMSIFHRHGDMSGNGPVMFSMANMVKPGTFDLSKMDEFSTPGISFFLQLPNTLGNMQCFENMLDAATAVKDGLDGALKDEDRNMITHQTLEHSRERIRDFELKQLSNR